MASNLDATHLALISLGGAMVFAAIRQADWKHPALIYGLLIVGFILGLVALSPVWLPLISSFERSGLASVSASPVSNATGHPRPSWWSVDAFGIACGGAIVLQIIRFLLHVPLRQGAIFADAMNVAAIYTLILLATSIAFDWPASICTVFTDDEIGFLLAVTYSLVVMAEIIRKELRPAAAS